MELIFRILGAIVITLIVLAILAVFLGFFILPFILVYLLFAGYVIQASIGLAIWTILVIVSYITRGNKE